MIIAITMLLIFIASLYAYRQWQFRKLTLSELIDLKRRHQRAFNRLSEIQRKSLIGKILKKTIQRLEKRINTLSKNVR